MSTNAFIAGLSTIGSVVTLASVIPTKRVAVSRPLSPTSPTIARSGVRLSMKEVSTRSLLRKRHQHPLALAPARPLRQLRRRNRFHRHLDEVRETRREVHARENLLDFGLTAQRRLEHQQTAVQLCCDQLTRREGDVSRCVGRGKARRQNDHGRFT